MTIKSTGDGSDDAAAVETMADRLRGVQLEPWKRVDFADEESPASWLTYQRSLLMHAAADEDKKEVVTTADAKGKAPAVEGQDEEDTREGAADAGAPDLHQRVCGLGTDWGEDELLRAVSGIKADDKKPGEEAVTDHVVASARGKGSKAPGKREPAVKPEPAVEGDGARRIGRLRKPAAPPATTAATAPRRGGRTKGTAMEID